MKKKNKKPDYTKSIIISGIVILLFGLYMLWVLGFHSFDSCQNYIFMQSAYEHILRDNDVEQRPVFVETSLNGREMTFEECYTDGIVWFIKGSLLSLFGAAMIGYGIRGINHGK